MTAPTESVVHAVVIGGGPAAQSANPTATAAVAAAGTGTETKEKIKTKNGHQKTKVKTFSFSFAPFKCVLVSFIRNSEYLMIEAGVL